MVLPLSPKRGQATPGVGFIARALRREETLLRTHLFCIALLDVLLVPREEAFSPFAAKWKNQLSSHAALYRMPRWYRVHPFRQQQ